MRFFEIGANAEDAAVDARLGFTVEERAMVEAFEDEAVFDALDHIDVGIGLVVITDHVAEGDHVGEHGQEPYIGHTTILDQESQGKASIVVAVTPDLTARFSAVDLVRKASEVLGGKGGGGKPDMAQAGGPDGAKADDALKAIEAALAG